MSDQLLRTCKRLRQFTLEDLELITETDKSTLKPVLENFIADEKIIFKNDIYFWRNENQEKKLLMKLPLLFQYNSEENIELISRAFCANISSSKTELLIGVADNTVCKFNRFFREIIYTNQLNELKNYFKVNPQTARMRMFFDQPMYFYYYNGKLFVSEELSQAPHSQSIKPNEVKVFKTIYSYLTRVMSHHAHSTYLPHHLAEGIWRRNKPFEQLLNELKSLIY